MKLAIISAVLYILAFPVFSLWPLAFFAIVPFLLAIERSDSVKKQMLIGFVWGFLASIGMGYWLMYAVIYHYNISVIKAIIFIIAGLILPVGIIYLLFAVVYNLIRIHIKKTA